MDHSSTRALAQLLADPVPDPATPEGLRALVGRIAELNGPGPRLAREIDREVPGSGVAVRLLGVAEPPRGVIVVVGLGGGVAGDPASYETVAGKLAERTSCDVALVRFRLAPEHPYPAAADDLYTATRWLWHERAALGFGDAPMMVLGEGLGAALAAGTVRRALRDPLGPRFALQLLICPVVDPTRTTDVPDGQPDPGSPLSRTALNRLWDCYLADPGMRTDPGAGPGLAEDWAGAPPTLVITAGHDAAAPEGPALADRLRAAGVPVVTRHFPDQMHGFFGILAARTGERAFQHVVRAVRGYTARAEGGAAPDGPAAAAWLERVVK